MFVDELQHYITPLLALDFVRKIRNNMGVGRDERGLSFRSFFMNTEVATSQTNKPNITAAELKTLRESLGLTSQWIADIASVRLRTAQYWESGRMAVPLDVSNKLKEIDLLLNLKVNEAINGYVNALINQYGRSIEIPLVRYRTELELWKYVPIMQGLPLTTYAVYLARLQNDLRLNHSINSFFGYIDIAEYKESIKKVGLDDSEYERALWVGRYYGKMNEAALRDVLFYEFLRLSNNPIKDGFSKPLTNEFCSQVLDDIVGYADSDEPKLKLLAFHFYSLKYKVFGGEIVRKKALDLSLSSLWLLGQDLTEQLCFSSALKNILMLCFKSRNQLQEGDFNKYLIMPIKKILSNKEEIISKNLQKIIAICEFLINFEIHPEYVGLNRDIKGYKSLITKLKKGVFNSEKSLMDQITLFLQEHALWNERVEDRIKSIDPQYSARKALKTMQYTSKQIYFSMPEINKLSLIAYLNSLKSLATEYTKSSTEYMFTNISKKIYSVNEVKKITLGENPENFYLHLSKEMLKTIFIEVDLSLSNEQMSLFINELQQANLHTYYTVENQSLILTRGIQLGISGYYSEAAFLLMPYIENLIRVRAREHNWIDKNHNDEYITPNREAVNLFLSGVADESEQQLVKLLYTIINDTPNVDVNQMGRIGDNLRNLSFHGLMYDEEFFNQNTQAKFKMVWTLTSILVLC